MSLIQKLGGNFVRKKFVLSLCSNYLLMSSESYCENDGGVQPLELWNCVYIMITCFDCWVCLGSAVPW
jgi:hypothetical protein